VAEAFHEATLEPYLESDTINPINPVNPYFIEVNQILKDLELENASSSDDGLADIT
jgi:hypothetical protein